LTELPFRAFTRDGNPVLATLRAAAHPVLGSIAATRA
jgi:hypothetical protein